MKKLTTLATALLLALSTNAMAKDTIALTNAFAIIDSKKKYPINSVHYLRIR